MPTVMTMLTDTEPAAVRPARGAHDTAILATISTLLAVPGAIGALYGFFLIIPPVLFIIGAYFAIGYWRAGGSPRPRAFWLASASFNAILAANTLVIIAIILTGEPYPSGDVLRDTLESLVLPILALAWQAGALFLSLRCGRNPRTTALPLASPAGSGKVPPCATTTAPRTNSAP